MLIRNDLISGLQGLNEPKKVTEVNRMVGDK